MGFISLFHISFIFYSTIFSYWWLWGKCLNQIPLLYSEYMVYVKLYNRPKRLGPTVIEIHLWGIELDGVVGRQMAISDVGRFLVSQAIPRLWTACTDKPGGYCALWKVRELIWLWLFIIIYRSSMTDAFLFFSIRQSIIEISRYLTPFIGI